MKSGTGVTKDTENRPRLKRTATSMTRGGRAPTPSAQRAAAAAFFTYRTITRARQSRQADAFRLLTSQDGSAKHRRPHDAVGIV